MIINSLTIKNFRSYYGEQRFEFSNRLNLILGANGDGKTTLFDAFSWLFATDRNNTDVVVLSALVSQKFFLQLPPAGYGEVKVSASITHANHNYIIERSFLVSKERDGKMKTSDHKHIGFMNIPGIARTTMPAYDIIERKGLFPAVIKKYCLFKGESELNIFKDTRTLQNLINLFSEVKDFEPYKNFSSYAEELANQARKTAVSKDRKNAEKAAEIKEDIRKLDIQLNSLKERRDDWLKSVSDYESKISDLDNISDTIELVHGLQDKINSKESEKKNKEADLDENYSIKLLDNYWILYGFMPILEEYAEKTRKISEERELLKQEYDFQQLKKTAATEAKTDALEELKKEFSQLPWFIPDLNTMREMLNEHRCKVCGTEAPEGSAPYLFMQKRLHEAIERKKGEVVREEKKTTVVESLFKNDFINSLRQHSISLYGFDSQIEQIATNIRDKIEDNDRIHEEIKELSHQIEIHKNKINEIIAQSASGVDVDSYYDLYVKLKNWSKNQSETKEKISDANIKIPDLEEKRDKLNKDLNKYIGKGGQIYAELYEFFSMLRKSLGRAESSSYMEFLEKLQEEANKYITILNVDDFSGLIDIYDNGNGKVFLQLIDKNGKIVEHPNTSLETTMHISILLAISELTKKERDNEYPLIFDAPTSTFDEGKDRDFYKCLYNNVEKQCIVVTKSFLNRNDNGDFEMDIQRLKDLQCPIYRIKKSSGLDKKDLSTVETIVEPYKTI